MRPALVLIACIAVIMPLVVADPVPNGGIPNACSKSPPREPCKFLPPPPPPPDNTIPDTNTVTDGNQTYTGDWTQVGTVVVAQNGTVTFDHANVSETNTSGGIVVLAGGTLVVNASTLQDAGGSSFAINVTAGATVRIVGSTIAGGSGVAISTSDVTLTGSLLTDMPTALTLRDVTATISGNTFAHSQVGVYQTGGQPTLTGNTFDDDHDCLVDYRTDPTVTRNTFVHCIIGIWHEESHSYLALNSLAEDGDPGSIGMMIINGLSPVIEQNDLTNFARAIVVQNARAYVRNNTIHGNGAGIIVDRNAAPMDVQGNLIVDNAGAGILLRNASDVTLARNTVRGNAGDGVSVADSTSITFDHDAAVSNNGTGFRVLRSSGALAGVNASANGGDGLLVDSQQLLAGTSIDCVRAVGNAGNGVVNLRGLHQAEHGWYAGNGGAGVLAQDLTSAVDATNSYWGAATGPKNAANPTGAGDEATGNVVFVPFLAAPPNAATCP